MAVKSDVAMRLLLAVLGMLSVVPLLAWVYDLGPFHVWFWTVAAPGAVALLGIAVWASTRKTGSDVHKLLSVALLAGLVGTLAYDLFRVPFVVVGGLRLLSPIESYGVLLVNTSASSGLTDFAGWSYHFSNGVGFAVTYAALARGRHWVWGVVWAMILETGTLVTPFANDYDLAGKWDVIAIAYAAHIPYGMALGLLLQRYRSTFGVFHESARRPGRWALASTIVVLALWLQPWQSHRPDFLASSDQAAIVNETMHPEFVRIAPRDCFSLFNADDVAYLLDQPSNRPMIDSNTSAPVCFDVTSVVRLRVTGRPFDGGFVIIDDFGPPGSGSAD